MLALHADSEALARIHSLSELSAAADAGHHTALPGLTTRAHVPRSGRRRVDDRLRCWRVGASVDVLVHRVGSSGRGSGVAGGGGGVLMDRGVGRTRDEPTSFALI